VHNIRSVLQRKNAWKQEFHIGRLQEQGMMPMHPLPSQVPASHPDPEADAVQAYDRPEHYEDAIGGEEQHAPAQGGFMQGTRSNLAEAGAALFHGSTYLAGAAAGAVAKGVIRGVAHLATGVNPLTVPDAEEEESHQSPEPLQPFAKAKAKPAQYGGSSGSRDKPHAWPARPFVDPAPYNATGAHAIFIGTDSEEEAPPAPAAPPRRSRLAKRDVRLAEQTLAAYGRR